MNEKFETRLKHLNDKIDNALSVITGNYANYTENFSTKNYLLLKSTLGDINNVLTLKLTLSFVDTLCEKFELSEETKLDWKTKINGIDPNAKGFDIDFFERFNEFILYLRNSTTHKTGDLTIVEKFKAELSVKMAFPYLEFYTNIIYPILSEKIEASGTEVLVDIDFETETGKMYYYALDGDDTGKTLENLFTNSTDEKKFKKTSEGIKKAITAISTDIKKLSSKDAIIFEAGDDLLFKGHFTMDELKRFQSIYSSETKGLTCSIGIGKTLLEVYLSLKLAKSQALKNSIKSLTFKNVH